MSMNDGAQLMHILGYLKDCVELAETVRQLPTCNDCAKARECGFTPAWGMSVRYNCPLWQGAEERKTNGDRC